MKGDLKFRERKFQEKELLRMSKDSDEEIKDRMRDDNDSLDPMA